MQNVCMDYIVYYLIILFFTSAPGMTIEDVKNSIFYFSGGWLINKISGMRIVNWSLDFWIPLVVIIPFILLEIFGMWRVFEKTGRKGWKSLIPFYNAWTLFDIVFAKGWLSIFFLVPLILGGIGATIAAKLSNFAGLFDVGLSLSSIGTSTFEGLWATVEAASIILLLVAVIYLDVVFFKLGKEFGQTKTAVLFLLFPCTMIFVCGLGGAEYSGKYSKEEEKSTANALWPIKSKSTAGILALLIGSLGIHRFYLEEAEKGILYILFFWTGIPAIVSLIEGITYLTSSKNEFMQKHHVRIE